VGFDTFEGAARRAAHFAWIERRLFEVVGGWVPSVPEPAVKLVLRAQSFHHAWHGELWTGLVPVGWQGTVTPPAALFDRLAEEPTTGGRLAGLHSVVLPALRATYERELAGLGSGEVWGGPVRRVLTLVLDDERRDAEEGDRLLRELGLGGEASPPPGLASLVPEAGDFGLGGESS
jgi:hypothetical protein